MLLNRRGIKIFKDYDLRQILDGQLSRLSGEIKSKNFDNIDKEEFIENITNEFMVKPLSFDSDDIAVDAKEEMIRSEYFPGSNFFVEPGRSYPKDVYTFFLPFKGDETLLRCVPSTRIMWTEEVAVENNDIVFQVIDFQNSPETVKKERDRILDFLNKQASYVNRDVEAHNQRIDQFIRNELGIKAEKDAHKKKVLPELGKPMESRKIQATITTKIPQPTQKEEKKYDVFISHASEDKDYVDSLAKRLKEEGLEVWYDTFEVNWGDDLRTTIDNGLVNSKFGIVVFSKAFLKRKKWTEYELNGLFAREKKGKNVVLPIRHKITKKDLEKYSPTFTDRVYKVSDNMDDIVSALRKII